MMIIFKQVDGMRINNTFIRVIHLHVAHPRGALGRGWALGEIIGDPLLLGRE